MKKAVFFLALMSSILLFLGGCPASSEPHLSLSVQELNREPGEVVEIVANPINFIPDGSEIYLWDVDYWSEDIWKPLEGYLFTQGSGQSAYLYLPNVDYEKLRIKVRTNVFVDGALKEINGSRILYYGDKPDVSIEVFETATSFLEPDSWLENFGTYKDERTPFYFRYVQGFSTTVLLEFDPFEGRIAAVVVEPNATPSEACVYIHGKEEILKSEYSLSDLDDHFDSVNIGESSWRKRIRIAADLSSVGADGLANKWDVDLYPDASGTVYDPDNESLFLIRGVRADGTLIADKLVDISSLLEASPKEGFDLKSDITAHFVLDESSLGIGPLLDDQHYFGIMLVGYAKDSVSSEFTGEVIFEIPTILGAEMVFSPDIDF